MLTWNEIDTRLSSFLDDTSDVKATWPTRQRIDAWNLAQSVLSNHTARESSAELAVDRNRRSAVLPGDFMEASMLYDPAAGMFYHQANFHHGGVRWDDDENYTYWTWGSVMYLERSVSFSEKLTLYYFAHWPSVEYSETGGAITVTKSDVLIPSWAELPLLHLTAGTLLQPHAVTSAMNREYNITIDSGKPIDNSRAQQSKEHFWWYAQLLALHPAQSRIGGIAKR